MPTDLTDAGLAANTGSSASKADRGDRVLFKCDATRGFVGSGATLKCDIASGASTWVGTASCTKGVLALVCSCLCTALLRVNKQTQADVQQIGTSHTNSNSLVLWLLPQPISYSHASYRTNTTCVCFMFSHAAAKCSTTSLPSALLYQQHLVAQPSNTLTLTVTFGDTASFGCDTSRGYVVGSSSTAPTAKCGVINNAAAWSTTLVSGSCEPGESCVVSCCQTSARVDRTMYCASKPMVMQAALKIGLRLRAIQFKPNLLQKAAWCQEGNASQSLHHKFLSSIHCSDVMSPHADSPIVNLGCLLCSQVPEHRCRPAGPGRDSPVKWHYNVQHYIYLHMRRFSWLLHSHQRCWHDELHRRSVSRQHWQMDCIQSLHLR